MIVYYFIIKVSKIALYGFTSSIEWFNNLMIILLDKIP